jgi:putative polyhydroxyalkanoate system protein
MSEIRVCRPHYTTLKKARKGAEHIAEELGEEFGLDHEWEGNTLRFQRMGVTGHIEVGKKEVEVYVKLGFLLMALGRASSTRSTASATRTSARSQ